MAPTRRSFLAQSVGALGAMAILPELSYARSQPAAKLNIGLVGAGRRSGQDHGEPGQQEGATNDNRMHGLKRPSCY